MKDEEKKATEYADSIEGKKHWSDENDSNAVFTRQDVEQAFLTGLKAGRPQWHDLRKAPNDLPKDDNYVLVSNGKDWTKAFYKDKKWNIICLVGFTKIIAWCEIPKYTEV